jgi:hypothetical protein
MTLDDLLPRLLVDVPSCPDFTAKLALVDAAIAFCEKTNAWNEIQDPFTLIDGQDIYDIDVPTDAQVARVMSVWSATRPLIPKTMAQITALMPNWQSAVGSAPLYFNSSTSSTQVRVFPKPMQALRAPLTPRVAYKPTLAATTLDDQLVNDYLQPLLIGAKSLLMLQRNKPWSDPQMAGLLAQGFAEAITEARIDITHERVESDIVATPGRPFGL